MYCLVEDSDFNPDIDENEQIIDCEFLCQFCFWVWLIKLNGEKNER